MNGIVERVEVAIRDSYLRNPFAKHLFRRLAEAAVKAASEERLTGEGETR